MALQSVINRRTQKGAALLALLMIFIVAASYSLVKKLNANSRDYLRQASSLTALNEAKAALIGYAVNYPLDHVGEGPGYLPCPDINNNGSAGSSCALNPNGTTIGRIPWKTLELSELRDASGERIWYAVADNYKNNPKVLTGLNSESSGNFFVDGNSDIVAIIFAPNTPFDIQDRADDPLDVSNYLEDDNADGDVNFVTRSSNDLNDTLITITRQEIMSAIEKRVLGEVKKVLSAYKASQAAYPWLKPFADPKTVEKRLEGQHTGSNDQANLTDSLADFTKWGVVNGDVVWNITDGSYGLVTGVSANTLTIGGGMNLSTDDFDTDDEYFVDVPTYPAVFIGTASATGGSSNLELEDTTKDFEALGVHAGDIVDVSDGSSGIIENISTTRLTVKSLTGTGDNTFDNNDNYRIRTSIGQATTASNGLTLNDTNVDFTVMGIQIGDLVRNVTDGSFGRVSVAPTTNQLTVDKLSLGTNNAFTDGDYYVLPRYDPVTNTRKGLLAFHESGEYFQTSFDIDWNIPELIGGVPNATITLNTPVTHPNYINNLKQFIQTSSGTTETISIDVDDGNCVWIKLDIINCKGIHTVYDPVQGQLTSGSNTATITDSTKDFITLGVNEGDIVQNYDDETQVASGQATAGSSGSILEDTLTTDDFNTEYNPIGLYNYLVRNTSLAGKAQGILSSIVDSNTLTTIDYSGSGVSPVTFSDGDNYRVYTPFESVVSEDVSAITTTSLRTNRLSGSNVDFDNQEFYRIKSATGRLSGTVATGSSGSTLKTGQDVYTTGVREGDVVHNLTDRAWGEITSVAPDGLTLTATMRTDNGTTRNFNTGDGYEIYYAYMNSRRYEFNVRFKGTTVINTVNGVRKRDVCLGYTDCAGSASNVSLPSDILSVPVVTIKDYDASETKLSDASLTIPNGGAQGSIKISNVDMFLSESYDNIPSWFVEDGWHKLIYIAYSSKYVPGATPPCAAGTDCLTLSGAGIPNNNKQALVLTAGAAVNTTKNSACSDIASIPQDRTNGTINEYYELENCNGDDTFQKQGVLPAFNDQIKIIEP